MAGTALSNSPTMRQLTVRKCSLTLHSTSSLTLCGKLGCSWNMNQERMAAKLLTEPLGRAVFKRLMKLTGVVNKERVEWILIKMAADEYSTLNTWIRLHLVNYFFCNEQEQKILIFINKFEIAQFPIYRSCNSKLRFESKQMHFKNWRFDAIHPFMYKEARFILA